MAQQIKGSFGSWRGENSIYRGENEKWQRDSIKAQIKGNFKKYPDLLNEILSELRKEKLQKIKDKYNEKD